MKGHPEVFEIHATKESKVANGEHWHSDVSCDEEPPLGTMLQIHILPQCGGDTMFNNMYTAYEALSEPIKDMISGLSALHSSEHFYKGRYSDRGRDDDKINYPEAVHPVVRTHPETGKKALFVNRTFTNRINELSKDESDLLLDLLYLNKVNILITKYAIDGRRMIWHSGITDAACITPFGTTGPRKERADG